MMNRNLFQIRDEMAASKYKHVVLGLIFLKYISDRFEDRYKELVPTKNN